MTDLQLDEFYSVRMMGRRFHPAVILFRGAWRAHHRNEHDYRRILTGYLPEPRSRGAYIPGRVGIPVLTHVDEMIDGEALAWLGEQAKIVRDCMVRDQDGTPVLPPLAPHHRVELVAARAVETTWVRHLARLQAHRAAEDEKVAKRARVKAAEAEARERVGVISGVKLNYDPPRSWQAVETLCKAYAEKRGGSVVGQAE